MKPQTMMAIRVASVVIVVMLVVFIFPSKEKQPEPTQPPAPVEPASCPDVSETESWLQEQLTQDILWRETNRRYYFTAKRMAMAPWNNYQNILQEEPYTPEDILAYNQSATCVPVELAVRMSHWNSWHRKRMDALENIKASYPQIAQ